ncbi:Na+/H+ antiporter NhaA [Aliifodinibius sp. S!AR15-10]|uniref:Na+/H+ antiporter NhaA n=1 Tax=Aliifodinibius sp. S!AR15-10 TaxID=2950437 RepID=UPI00285FBB43|nr:Na+/H+ antiporter NhaA [Aliifodinibius sp. S!AR15-10]MDR8392193.1 Na+/H+ antiporter NhaA [Aliifodinibius sp. S!AR15-10]
MADSSFSGKLKDFFKKDSAAGIMLLLATVAALIVANSPLGEAYHHLLETHIVLGFSDFMIDESLHHWINDGLMAIFFLLVGLEIKRELKYGELSSFQSALLPVVAAVGGATVPALIFFGFNGGTDYMNGWAIPMATDIAFVIGVLALLGSRVPVWAKVFVTAVAVVDDLIAVLVIAFFYTESISMVALGVAGACMLVILLLNYRGVNKLGPYLIIGFIMWWAVLKSGVHATIAGVVLGFLIPASRGWSVERLVEYAREGFELFEQASDKDLPVSREQALHHMDATVEHAESPLHRLEHKLHFSVYFLIMPIFAFANAGVIFDPETMGQAFISTLTWGIALGLFFGKQIGIWGSTWILTKLNMSGLNSSKETWKVVYGVSLLSGIGFTMSLFIGNLSFPQSPVFLEYAKVGILLGSLVSGLLGYFYLSRRPDVHAEEQEPLNVPDSAETA